MLRNRLKSTFATAALNYFKTPSRNYTPRRALLYVPADDMKKVLKAFSFDVDCVTLDCEDGVAFNKKTQARHNIRKILDSGKPQKQRAYDFVVRVNPPSSPIIDDDLDVILTGEHLPDTIFLPKVDTLDHLKMFSEKLNKFIKREAKVNLIIGVESGLSLVNIVDICKSAQTMTPAKFTPVALLFGSDDFYASIGARKTESSFEIMYARQKLVTVAKAFELQAIDMVYIQYKDHEGLHKQAKEGAQMGFSGKQVIHPGQVEVVQKAFLPTDEEIKWAKDIVKAFYKHQEEGTGAFTFKGSMIDMPTMRQAQNIIDLVNAVMILE